MHVFVNGELFEDTWNGTTAMAMVEIDAGTLYLRDLTIYATDLSRSLPGLSGNRQWLRRIMSLARGQGLKRLVLEFDRLTGANPRDGRVRAFDLSP